MSISYTHTYIDTLVYDDDDIDRRPTSDFLPPPGPLQSASPMRKFSNSENEEDFVKLNKHVLLAEKKSVVLLEV